MNHKYFAEYENVLLRPLEHEDIEKLRVWRNDTHATRFLRPIGHISSEMQEQWYGKYLSDRSIISFAIVETHELNRMVGSVSLYDFDGDAAEFGKIQIGDEAAHGKGIGRLSTALALWIGFKKLDLSKIIAVVHQQNVAAHKTYMRVGFKITGQKPSEIGGYEDRIEITLDELIEANSNFVMFQDVKI